MALRLILALMLVVYLAGSVTSCAAQGRAHIEMERKIVKMTKQMVEEERDVKAFAKLLKELDEADTGESTREFWQVARQVSDAMTLELGEGLERLDHEEGAEALKAIEMPDTSEGESPLSRRVRRMRAVVTESDGLRSPLAMADPSALARYRALAGEFQALLEADVEEMKAEVESLKSEQRAARR